MANIALDYSIITHLKQLPVRDDGLFNNFERELLNQLQFITDVLLAVKPEHILEIGTNHCYFPYFALCVCPKVKIDTVDIQKESRAGVEFINKQLGAGVRFHNKKSSAFFKSFRPGYAIDLAWIDGSHKYEDCLSDLKSCRKLKIKNICIDDFRSNLDVLTAVIDFCRTAPYRVAGQSYFCDTRGIIHLTYGK